MNIENKVSIILTTTVHVTQNSAFQVNKTDRINTYLKSIHLWLKYTDFNIIVVENSGYLFEELDNELNTSVHFCSLRSHPCSSRSPPLTLRLAPKII